MVVVDTHVFPTWTLRSQPLVEGGLVVRAPWRPAELGDRGQAREGHVVDVRRGHQRLAPQRGLDSRDGRRRDTDQIVARIPAVRRVDLDVAGPVLAELRPLV